VATAPRLDCADEVKTVPIAGVVVSTYRDKAGSLEEKLHVFPGVETHGGDGRGHLIAVLEAPDREGMETLIRRLEAMDEVLNVGITFLAADTDCTDEEEA
jgi:nitrate reductase NapAB chaperone NapD